MPGKLPLVSRVQKTGGLRAPYRQCSLFLEQRLDPLSIPFRLRRRAAWGRRLGRGGVLLAKDAARLGGRGGPGADERIQPLDKDWLHLPSGVCRGRW